MTPRDDASDKTGSLFRMLQDKLELERKFGVDAIPAGEVDTPASSDTPSPRACPDPSGGRGEDTGEG